MKYKRYKEVFKINDYLIKKAIARNPEAAKKFKKEYGELVREAIEKKEKPIYRKILSEIAGNPGAVGYNIWI